LTVVSIAGVVEGHGKEEALPVLLRRIAADVDPQLPLNLPRPIRRPKSTLVKPGELENAVELAVRRVDGRGGVLVLLDADDDCPAQLGSALLQRARIQCGHVPLAVVIANREFEAWFLAAATSLRGHRGLGASLQPPAAPEAIQDAKGWLSARMVKPGRYVETLHQASLAARFDLNAARSARSFDKFYRDVERLIAALRSSDQPTDA
jgi:hypothetical protein